MSGLSNDLRRAYEGKYNAFIVTSFMHGVWWARISRRDDIEIVREQPYVETPLMWDDVWKAVYENDGPLHLEEVHGGLE